MLPSLLPSRLLFAMGALALLSPLSKGVEPVVMNIWPDKPPGDTRTLPPENDQTKDTDKLIAGRRIIKLGNVSTPQIAVYLPEKSKANGTAVIICPGGGFNILAYDLEGTEVAEWLNGLGVTAIVLKYRVPFRDAGKKWLAPVQDVQRATSITRSRAKEWGIDEKRIGTLGFSAGGITAVYAALLGEDRQYPKIDKWDDAKISPDFSLLIYTGGFVERGKTTSAPAVPIGKNTPPLFLVHAFDDDVPVQNSLLLASEYRAAGGSAELHVYDAGGHGYGMRPVASLPVTTWPARAEEWLLRRGIIPARK